MEIVCLLLIGLPVLHYAVVFYRALLGQVFALAIRLGRRHGLTIGGRVSS